MPKKFSDLLRAAWNAFVPHWKTAAILAVVVGVLMQLAQMGALVTVDDSTRMMMNGMSEDQMEDLVDRMESGDEAAMNDLLKQLGAVNPDGTPVEDQDTAVRKLILGSVWNMLPALSLYFVLVLIITVIAQSAYLIFAVEKVTDFQVLWKRSLKVAPKLFGVWVWSFLRSFVWIPIIGIIPAIILGPRFALAPYLLIKEKKGVKESVSKSHAMTTGYWGKIVGNSLLLGILFVLVTMVIGIPLSILNLILPALHLLGELVMGQLVAIFGLFFMVQLAETIQKNPRTAKKK